MDTTAERNLKLQSLRLKVHAKILGAAKLTGDFTCRLDLDAVREHLVKALEIIDLMTPHHERETP
jgi:hypothetical protein